MISPSWSFAEVLALNALQNSMMLTPCGPSAVPTGGAGVALPAGICSFTEPVTFFAISTNSLVAAPHERRLYFFHLQEIQLHRCGATENRHHDPQRVALGVDLVHLAGEIRERPVDDTDVLVLFKAELGPGPLGR